MSNSAQSTAASIVISAGSADANSAVVWARSASPFTGSVEIKATNPAGASKTYAVQSDAKAAHTIKKLITDLQPNTTYQYTFSASGNSSGTALKSLVGTFKTAPKPTTAAPVRFGFSSCADSAYAPFHSVADIDKQKLDFFVIQGDAIYEDDVKKNQTIVSNEVPAPFNPATPNTPDTAKLNATKAALDRKFLENISPTNPQNVANGNLTDLYRSTGIYATYDNHEMVDTALEAGGAPKNGITHVSWPAVEASKTPNNTAIRGGSFFREGLDASPQNLVNKSKTFLNQRPEHKGLVNTWFENMPERNRGTIISSDPRENGLQKLYYAQPWGKHAIMINVDDRTFRDAKITALKTTKDSLGNITRISEDDVTDSSIDGNTSSGRTILGAKQLTWLKQTLSNAQKDGTTWKFVSISSPIDITGKPGDSGKPEQGKLDVDAKSWWGNYRAERNELLKYIADNKINNVVFLSGDDHEGRVARLSYAPDGKIDNLTNYKAVPHAFTIVSSPIGASRPGGFVNAIKTAKDGLTGIAANYAAEFNNSGLLPIGLGKDFPGLTSLTRHGIAGYSADVKNPKLIDFWTPNSFNYGVIDVDSTGKLKASLRGIPPTDKNAFPASAPAVEDLLSFSIAPVLA